MATPNLASALDRPAGSVEKPKPAPVGSFQFIVAGLPRYDKSSKKQTDFVEFTCKYQTPFDDVDQEAMQEWLTSKDGSTRVLHEQTTKLTFYITENSLWRLNEFLSHLGFDVEGEDADKSLRELTQAATNRSFGGRIVHESSEDGKSIFAKIGTTFAIEG